MYFVGIGVIYLVLIVTLGILTIRKGHWVLFLIGIIFPILWIIGAIMPPVRGRRGYASGSSGPGSFRPRLLPAPAGIACRPWLFPRRGCAGCAVPLSSARCWPRPGSPLRISLPRFS